MNNDLELIYVQSFESEKKNLMNTYMLFLDRARDKQLSTGAIGGLFVLQDRINYAGKLSARIKEQFDTGYRLGMNMDEIVSEIKPQIILFQKKVNEYRAKMKPRIKGINVQWKKNKYGIPTRLEYWQFKYKYPDDPFGATGAFFDVQNDADISYELGKMKALQEVILFVKEQHVALGGTIEGFGKQDQQIRELYIQLADALKNETLPAFISLLKTLFAKSPYQLDKYESTYHNIIHTIIALLGFEIISELPTNNGRIDSVIQLEKAIYIIEFKVDKNDGLAQIEEKKYYQRYLHQGKRIILLSINISSSGKTIGTWDHRIIHPEAIVA